MPTLQGLGRSGGVQISTQNGVVRIEETFSYIVYADYAGQPATAVANAPGMPTVGVTLATGGLTICKTLSGTFRASNPTIWDFTANFSSQVEDNTQQPEDQDPNEWVPVYQTRFERLQEIVTKDKTTPTPQNIANSAGQAFNTGLTISRFIPIWTFTQFEPASVDDETIIDRNETINSSTFKGRAAKSLLLTVQDSVLGYYYGQRRRLTTYELRYNERLWTHKRLDTGTLYLDGSTLKAYTVDGVVVNGPLDGAGAKQTGGDPPEELEFEIYDQLDFNSFLRG